MEVEASAIRTDPAGGRAALCYGSGHWAARVDRWCIYAVPYSDVLQVLAQQWERAQIHNGQKALN